MNVAARCGFKLLPLRTATPVPLACYVEGLWLICWACDLGIKVRDCFSDLIHLPIDLDLSIAFFFAGLLMEKN